MTVYRIIGMDAWSRHGVAEAVLAVVVEIHWSCYSTGESETDNSRDRVVLCRNATQLIFIFSIA